MIVELTLAYEGTSKENIEFDVFPCEIPQEHLNRKNKLIVFSDIHKAISKRKETHAWRKYGTDVSIKWSR